MTIPKPVTGIKSPMSVTDSGIVMLSNLQKAKILAKDRHYRKIRKRAVDGKLVERRHL